jgi:hypothetical protein
MKLYLSPALLVIGLALSCAPKLIAQDTIRIVSKGIYTGEQVVLRWAPKDIESWRYSNEHGYSLERKTLRSDGQTLTTTAFNASYVLLTSSLVALPENQWEALADSSDLAGIAAGSIYGDSLDMLPPEGAGLLQIYNKSLEVENRFGFSLFAADQDIKIAKAMGLAFVDTSVQAGKEYVYFIKALGTVTTEGGFASVETDSALVTTVPSGLEALAADKAVMLQWNKDETLFSSFVVERAVGVSGAFVQMNTSPLMYASTVEDETGKMSYLDSLVDNSTVYVYRVRGQTPFGILSAPSDTIHITGRAGPLAFLFSIREVQELNVGALTINWQSPDSLEAQMLGFDVFRSDKVDGVYSKLNTTPLGTTVRTFEDTQPLPVNYYVVKTLDTNGYEYRTFPYLGQPVDNTPPEKPVMLTAECSPTGVVTLTWPKSSDPYILGYRVYMSNVEQGDYAQITGTWVKDTVYKYQIEANTLSEEAYFAIKALDLHQNQSLMSDPMQVMRPDIIPPSPPVIKTVEAQSNGVYFEWELSASKDVISYTLERKELGVMQWIDVVQFSVQDSVIAYTDTTASVRKKYEYRLIATDDAELQSSSNIIKTKPVDTGLRHAIQNFAGQLIQSPKSVVLQWEYTNDADLVGFEIFRAINDVNKQRSYDYLKIPPGQPAGAASNGSSAVLNGNTWNCVFTDRDVVFSLLHQNTFVVFPNPNANTNAAVPAPAPPQQGTTVSTFVVQNPNNLAGQQNNQPTQLHYWVMAKYADGAYSPIAGHITIHF